MKITRRQLRRIIKEAIQATDYKSKRASEPYSLKQFREDYSNHQPGVDRSKYTDSELMNIKRMIMDLYADPDGNVRLKLEDNLLNYADEVMYSDEFIERDLYGEPDRHAGSRYRGW